jgi:2'-5' RNA ligase
MDNLLEQLKESWQIMSEGEQKEPSFCYMVYVAPDDAKDFADMQKELELDGELVESDKFHATIRYVKTDKDYSAFVEHIKSIELPSLTATCTNFAIYGKKKDTLVLELDSKPLHKWFTKINEWLTEHGFPKSDFPDYKPHISLTEKEGIVAPEWNDTYAKKVTFRIHVVTNTAHDEVLRRKSK